MAQVLLDGDALVVRLGRLERVMAQRWRDVEVPVSAVVLANATREPMVATRGWRWPGSYVPGVVAVGAWRWEGGRDFLALRPTVGPALVVDLVGAEFSRLLVSTGTLDEAQTLAALLRPHR